MQGSGHPNLGVFGEPNSFSAPLMFGLKTLENLTKNTLSTAGNAMTRSERPSPEPLLKKEASPAVLRGREFWKCSGSCRLWWIPAVLSRGIPGNALRAFPEFFWIFVRKVPSVLGVWPTLEFIENMLLSIFACGRRFLRSTPSLLLYPEAPAILF